MKTNSLILHKLASILCIALIAASALCATGCGSSATDGTTNDQAQNVQTSQVVDGVFEDGATLGEGATQFAFTVVDTDGNEVTATVNTDAKTLGEVLLDLGVIAGDDSEYGLYVKTVNGTTLDYDTDGKYWALYVGDQYATTGVDSTELEAGATYSFKAE